MNLSNVAVGAWDEILLHKKCSNIELESQKLPCVYSELVGMVFTYNSVGEQKFQIKNINQVYFFSLVQVKNKNKIAHGDLKQYYSSFFAIVIWKTVIFPKNVDL